MFMGVIAASRRRAGAAAVGAVASLSDVHANGWTATWNGTPPTFVPDGGAASQHYVSVVRQGFDANGAATSYIDRHVVTARPHRDLKKANLLNRFSEQWKDN